MPMSANDQSYSNATMSQMSQMQKRQGQIQSSHNENSHSATGTLASNNTGTKGRWTSEEHKLFLEALRKFGKDWQSVEDFIGTRSSAQIRSHAQKFLNKLEKDPDPQYDDIKKILDVNLRLLKKCDKDPNGHGYRRNNKNEYGRDGKNDQGEGGQMKTSTESELA